MRHSIFLFLIFVIPSICFAGIETVLLEEAKADCMVRVTHDATPSSETGTIVFRSYQVVDELHYPCDLSEAQVTESLSTALTSYIANKDLKPATSIFVGRVSRFPWVNADWLAKSQSGSYEKMSYKEFNAFVASSSISKPFEMALTNNNLEFNGASCEKIQYYKNGYPMDALCWFLIKPVEGGAP